MALYKDNPLVPVMPNFDVLVDVILGKLLNKQAIWLWLDTPWRSCDITVMHIDE